MSIRYWTMAAFTLGVVLLLPGVVFANGNGHQSVHGSHPAKNPQGQVQHPDDRGKSDDSHRNVSQNKDRPKASHGQKVSQEKASKEKQAARGKQHGQGAEHANQQAQQHAADASAVQQTVDHSRQNPASAQQAEHQQHHKKTEDPAELIHNDANPQVTQKQAEKDSEFKDPAKPSAIEWKRNHSPQVHQMDQTVSQKETLPEKPKPKKIQKPRPQPQPKKQPEPVPAPKPIGVFSSSPTGPGTNDQPQPRKGQGYGSLGMNPGIAPEWLNHTGVSVQSFITQRAQYGNQWINAPPSPPPKTLLLFQNQAS
ncbi:MAG TPA: hypothetical protein VFK33_14880 [Bacillales bacterium]|nr:hypothetical protein [Bacillales bacterium]